MVFINLKSATLIIMVAIKKSIHLQSYKLCLK
jgi:hypothetical protein